jgi:hypothetical protein
VSKSTKFKIKNKIFIETGSYLGDGIQLALDSGYKEIYSIELCPNLHNTCKQRFHDNLSVNLLQGDSSVVLKNLLQILSDKLSLTFWLDGHYSGPHTAKGTKDCPLMEELEAILSRSNKTNDLVYVDDMRIYRNFDSDVNEENMIKLIKKYKPNAIITYEDTVYGVNDIMIVEY